MAGALTDADDGPADPAGALSDADARPDGAEAASGSILPRSSLGLLNRFTTTSCVSTVRRDQQRQFL